MKPDWEPFLICNWRCRGERDSMKIELWLTSLLFFLILRWLVRVLRSQEVGYIPAENIETPFERLARLNKHRNVDVSN